MIYDAAGDRYDSMTYRRCGRSGLKLPAISLGLWHNFGHDRPCDTPARHLPARVRPRRHPLRPGQQLRPAVRRAEENFGRMLATDFRPLPRRAGHLHQGRVRHVARPVRRVGFPQVPDSPRWTSRCAGWAWTTSTSSTRHRPDPDTPLEETMGALDAAVRAGKALYVGISSYPPSQTREAAAILRRAGHAAADPPAVVLDDQPLDRGGRAARRAGGGRRRLHRLLAAGPGPAHRPVPATASRPTRASPPAAR